MGYRIPADEYVERATRNYRRKLDHHVRWIGDFDALGLGADDESIAAYSTETDSLIVQR